MRSPFATRYERAHRLVSVSCRIVLGTDDQTPSLLRAAVDRLDDVDELLLVLEDERQLIVVTSSQIAHDVFIALYRMNQVSHHHRVTWGRGTGQGSKQSVTYEEEHDGARVVQLVHGVEVRHAVYVTDIDDCEVLNFLGDFVENLVLTHAIWV